MFPKQIQQVVKNLPITEIVDFHRSGDKVYDIGKKYIVKTSQHVARLQNEYNKDSWLHNYIPSPNPLCFVVENNVAYYLREYLLGENLCLDKYLNDPLQLVDILVDALNVMHNVNVTNKQYLLDQGYDTLVHGDFCLPNVLVQDGKFSGFIDLGDAGIGDPWRDYAWCIWSLEYNLKTKHYTPILLQKLGIKFDQDKFAKYTTL